MNMNTSEQPSLIKRAGFHLLVLGLICAAIYLPTVLSPFQKHDDYIVELCNPDHFCGESLDYSYYVRIGRILAAELTFCFLEPFCCAHPGVTFFIWLRVFSLLFIGLSAGIFSFWIASVCRLNKWTAVMMTVLLFTLPAYQFLIGQALAINSSCCFIFIMAALLVLKDQHIEGKWSEVFKDKKRMALSISLLLIPLFIYNPHTLWFLMPSLILLLFTPSSDLPRKRIVILRHLLVLGSAIMLFFVIQKLVIEPTYLSLHPDVNFNVSKRVHVESSLPKIISNFARSFYKGKAFNLWFVQDVYLPGKIFFSFIVFTVFVFLMREGSQAWRQGVVRQKLQVFGQYLLVVAVVYVGVNSIQIFFEPSMGFFRILLHYSAFILVLLLWSLHYLVKVICRSSREKVFLVCLFFLAFFSSGMAQYSTIHDFVFLSMSELDFLEVELQPLLDGRVGTVYVVRPRGNPRVSGDEHGILTTRYANTYGLQGMIKRIYRRNNKDFSNIEIVNMGEGDAEGYIMKVTDKEVLRKGDPQQTVIHMDKLLKVRVIGYHER